MDGTEALRDRQSSSLQRVLRSPVPETRRRPEVRDRTPLFPRFKPLEMSDQFEIERWVSQFPPYSDFNFVSLWSWNTTGEFEFCWLNGNLVILFTDYGTGEPFLSFIGAESVFDTALQLLDYAREQHIVEELRLLPEMTVRALESREGLKLTHTPQHQDYVLSTEEWSTLAGGEFRKRRSEIATFERKCGPECRLIDLSDPEIQQQVQDVFGRWVVQRERGTFPATVNESLAVLRVFTLQRPQDLLTIGLYVDDKLAGYSINERLGGVYAMGHHAKVAGGYSGGYAMMLRFLCRLLVNDGAKLLNIQQDLGEPGLALAKRLYRPVTYLHKFQIARANDLPEITHDASGLGRDAFSPHGIPPEVLHEMIGADYAHV